MDTSNPDTTPEKAVLNPEEDDIEVELEFYDEAMEGVEGVSMPDLAEELQEK